MLRVGKAARSTLAEIARYRWKAGPTRRKKPELNHELDLARLLAYGLSKRKPLRKAGARARRAAPALEAFRAALRARSFGRCERCARTPTLDNPLDPHHVVGRGRAIGWPQLHDAELNGLLVCRSPCHEALTSYPHGTGIEEPALKRRINRAFLAFEKWRAKR